MILVTGGAGYIGAIMVEELLNRGFAVRVFDKLYFGKQGLQKVLDRIELIQGDIRTIDSSVLDGVTGVIHLAGLSNDPMAEFNPKANTAINTEGTRRLGELCKKQGIERLTYASSASIYDRGLYASDVLRDEDSEVEPRAAYAISKYKGERALLELCDEKFCPVILRQGTVYGYSPRMRFDLVVNTFLKDALTKKRLTVLCGGEMWRPLVDVTDVARAHIACLEAPADQVRGEVFNLAFKNYRILELAHWVRFALRNEMEIDIHVDYEERQARSYRISAEKIERVLGVRHQISVADSVEVMLDKIRSAGITDFSHPRYYNIHWLNLLVEMEEALDSMGGVF
jgi:nucleoside-diphosphate-sugar epimerase